MLKPYVARRLLLGLLAATVVALLVGPATADTIYLKNGRVLRSSSVRQEGEKIIFVQYGSEQAIPLAMVDRIEKDENVEPEPTVATEPEPEAQDTSDQAAAGTAEGAEVAPEQTQEYWQNAVRAIQDERAQVELTIGDLRREEQAFLFSHRSTAQTRQGIENAQRRLAELDQQMSDLEDQARRLNVPPGWLRLPAGGGGGGTSGGGSGGGTGTGGGRGGNGGGQGG